MKKKLVKPTRTVFAYVSLYRCEVEGVTTNSGTGTCNNSGSGSCDNTGHGSCENTGTGSCN